MEYRKIMRWMGIALVGVMLAACGGNDGPGTGEENKTPALGTDGIALNDGEMPAVDQSPVAWTGQKATDADKDVVGADADVYHEASTFGKKVEVDFNGNSATVACSESSVKTDVRGGYVTVDFQSESVSGVEIIVSGNTADGGLKIYGGSKFKLTLNGAKIESKKGPAINNQCKKRMFVHLADGTVNLLADSTTYSDDPYYKPGSNSAMEDRKGCFFSEGNMIFSGTGILEVSGRQKHGIASDGYMVMRPGVTIAVTEAAKNCVHLKGDEVEGIGLEMMGGYLYANAAGEAGKGVKTDQNIRVEGGQMVINTTGDAIYDATEADTSSPACLKADTYVDISGGSHEFRSTGKGGKGINATTWMRLSGESNVLVSCSGARYDYSEAITASAKGIKATDAITLKGGSLTVVCNGENSGSKGIESDKKIDITSDCHLTAYAYDDAINASEVNISGSESSAKRICAYSVANDAIRGKQSVTISGGVVMAMGASSPKSGVSCGTEGGLKITGGSVLAMGGSINTLPSATGYPVYVWSGLTARKGASVRIVEGETADAKELDLFQMPRSYEGGVLMVAGSKLPKDAALNVFADGSLAAFPYKEE